MLAFFFHFARPYCTTEWDLEPTNIMKAENVEELHIYYICITREQAYYRQMDVYIYSFTSRTASNIFSSWESISVNVLIWAKLTLSR